MDEHIGKRADCIVGVAADRGLADLSEEFKKRARKKGSRIVAVLRVGPYSETITGEGHPDLSFTHPRDIVLRKSTFICPRTLMIKADKSARDIDRRIKRLLRDENQKIVLEIKVTN